MADCILHAAVIVVGVFEDKFQKLLGLLAVIRVDVKNQCQSWLNYIQVLGIGVLEEPVKKYGLFDQHADWCCPIDDTFY